MGLIEIGSAWMLGRAVGPSLNGELALTCWKRARTQSASAIGAQVRSDDVSTKTLLHR